MLETGTLAQFPHRAFYCKGGMSDTDAKAVARAKEGGGLRGYIAGAVDTMAAKGDKTQAKHAVGSVLGNSSGATQTVTPAPEEVGKKRKQRSMATQGYY